ncbi:MAG: DUF4364 family protein [Lachnospiraceae bacterium]|nr:DUF4364 family protein [Lachnospiraceae bacterium]
MQNDALTIYKLVILFMLKKVDFPLNTSQFSEFFVDRSYTDFLTLQQSLNSLLENGFVSKETVRNSSQYSLTPAGEEALEMFQYKISDGFQDDVLDFFTENKYKLRNEVEVYSNYIPASDNEYIVECVVKEKNSTVLNIKLNVATKDMAIAVCDNWKEQSSEVYTYLINQLILNNQNEK